MKKNIKWLATDIEASLQNGFEKWDVTTLKQVTARIYRRPGRWQSKMHPRRNRTLDKELPLQHAA